MNMMGKFSEEGMNMMGKFSEDGMTMMGKFSAIIFVHDQYYQWKDGVIVCVDSCSLYLAYPSLLCLIFSSPFLLRLSLSLPLCMYDLHDPIHALYSL